MRPPSPSESYPSLDDLALVESPSDDRELDESSSDERELDESAESPLERESERAGEEECDWERGPLPSVYCQEPFGYSKRPSGRSITSPGKQTKFLS